jgi:uncharacterized membrane protein YgcG
VNLLYNTILMRYRLLSMRVMQLGMLVLLLLCTCLSHARTRKSSVFSETEVDHTGSVSSNNGNSGSDGGSGRARRQRSGSLSQDSVDMDGDADYDIDIDSVDGRSGRFQDEDDHLGSGMFGDSSVHDFGLVFDPPLLEFTDTQALLPVVMDFSIHNRNPATTTRPITIHSVVANNSQFHTVTFQQQALYYQDSVSVHIMFLPYFVDRIETKLLISTSMGDVSYSISGHAMANPYHLHPFIGYRIPAGELVYEQPISVFNPHSEALNIREIFTTESFLSLQYPTKSSGNSINSAGNAGSNTDVSSSSSSAGSTGSGKKQLPGKQSDGGHQAQDALSSWIVPPGVEKEVMLLSMSAKVPGTYNGYVHIVCDRGKFVVPVELIALEGGVRLEPDSINFGVLTEMNEVRTQDVFVVNSGLSSVRILDMVTDFPDPQLSVTR